MFLSFWHEYYEFFIIIGSLILLMLIAYLIFFKPNNAHNNEKKEKLNNHEEPDDGITLNDDFTESELDEEFLAEEVKEEFVLGEHSNILESLPKDKAKSKLDPIKIKVDHAATDEIFGEFKTIDELIKEKDEENTASNQMKSQLEKMMNIEDHEKVLTEIVNSVIPREDLSQDEINGKFHVLYRKEDQKWYVKREGAKKGERFLITQKEAIAYATIQALIYETTIVVHDEDGKIGKYEF